MISGRTGCRPPTVDQSHPKQVPGPALDLTTPVLARRTRSMLTVAAATLSVFLTACETVTTVVIPVHTVQLNPSSLRLEEGASGTFSVEILGDEGSRLRRDAVTWSTDEAIASVTGTGTSGTVIARSAGQTDVRVTVEGVTGQATLSVTRPPDLSVSPTTADFEVTEGSTPSTQSVVVQNVGGGSLNWTATPSQSWLEANPAVGTLGEGGTQAVTIGVNSSALAPGTYDGSIVVSGASQTVTVGVRLVVIRPPKLAVQPTNLSFSASEGTSPDSKSLVVQNVGGGTLLWSAAAEHSSSTEDWLSVDPALGALAAGEALTITVAVNTDGLSEGSYTANVVVTGVDHTDTVAVGLVIDRPPKLAVSPASLDFSDTEGSDPPGQSIVVRNVGGGTLDWTAAAVHSPSTEAWLVLDPALGTLGPGDSATVTVGVNSSALAAGGYGADIVLTGAGQTATVPVTLVVVRAQVLAVNRAKLDFSVIEGSNPLGQSIEVRNVGGGTLNWNAAAVHSPTTENWLRVVPTIGVPLGPEQSFPVAVEVNSVSLPAGTYVASVVFTGAGQTVTVPVTLAVLRIPALAIDPASLDFTAEEGSNPVSKLLVLRNTGDPSFFLNWVATETQTWLSLSHGSGRLAGEESDSITVQVSSDGLPLGTYATTILFNAVGENLTVDVTLVVEESRSGGEVSFVIGSSSNALQTFDIDLTAEGIAGTPSSVSVTRVDFRGDFEASDEYVDVSSPLSGGLTRGPSTRVGATDDSGDTPSWTESTTLAFSSDVAWETYVLNGNLFMRVWVDPSSSMNVSPSGMSNWWELRFFVSTDLSFTRGSSTNSPLQVFDIDLTAAGISGTPSSILVTRVDFRGAFGTSAKYVDVSAPLSGGQTKGSSTRVGAADDSGDTTSWTVSTTLAFSEDVPWNTYVANGRLFMRVWVDPSAAITSGPTGMANWWELRFFVAR